MDLPGIGIVTADEDGEQDDDELAIVIGGVEWICGQDLGCRRRCRG